MQYPLISEYVEAIRSAEDNFDQLSDLRPVLDSNGNPVMSSGNFAVVFKMQNVNTKQLFAVKCFTREQAKREEHYRKIADELEFTSSPYLLHFSYLEDELFVDTTQGNISNFPIVVMDWAEGVTLDNYLNAHLHDSYALQLLAYRFCRMAAWLLSQPFAHGDLKPDNILVKKDGSLVLVDYDGMFVPALQGENASELGSPDFRHPLRTEASFNEHIDDFAIASIALSLKAIALQPALYNQFATADRLLLSASDYRDIGKSAALQAILALSSDAELSKLFSAFLLASSLNSLDMLSFRLFIVVAIALCFLQFEILPISLLPDDVGLAAAIATDRLRTVGTHEHLHVAVKPHLLRHTALWLHPFGVADPDEQFLWETLLQRLILLIAHARVLQRIDANNIRALPFAESLHQLIDRFLVKYDEPPSDIHHARLLKGFHQRCAHALLQTVVRHPPEPAEILAQLQGEPCLAVARITPDDP